MGYALFAQRKLTLDGVVNSVQLQQNQRSDEQMNLSTRTISLQSQISNIQASQSSELGELYKKLATATDSAERNKLNGEIDDMKTKFEVELTSINDKIYMTSMKENAIEMEVKRLDTKLTALQKQLEQVEEAEGKGIESATPKFNGIG